nr:MAG TPA: hypothetical protein [Caudoviricetes sp.]
MSMTAYMFFTVPQKQYGALFYNTTQYFIFCLPCEQ